jgi:hypothetical protein
MENKTFFISLISILAVIIIALIILFVNKPSVNASPLEPCNTLSFSKEGAIGITFFGSKNDSMKYTNYIKTISPFDKADINFYYIDSYKPNCELYKGIAILCYSKELIRKAASCKSNYIAVLSNQPSNIRSSSYMNVLSINTASPISVFAHELAHSLAFLAEEYIPGEISSKTKNCLSEENKNNLPESFKGCSKDNYYRSIENGIMRTLSSSTFGSYDESLILEKIPSSSKTSLITGNVISEDCNQQQYYLISATYNNNEVTINNIEPQQGCLSTTSSGAFNYTLIGDYSISQEFNPELIFTDVQVGDSLTGETFISDKEFYIQTPKIQESQMLQISKDNKVLALVNLQSSNTRPCQI